MIHAIAELLREEGSDIGEIKEAGGPPPWKWCCSRITIKYRGRDIVKIVFLVDDSSLGIGAVTVRGLDPCWDYYPPECKSVFPWKIPIPFPLWRPQ